ncbi:adenosine deaminase [Salmonella enterica]|uniref:adenosine deaminase n=1 Tax=Salmonella enterica TaxID=28901 RepID=UPI000DA2DACF|nr:adenosine deaminase [Salmonella enterica]ECH9066773.1 adenosine deaminase [Salmonella enterica subsp. enterica]ECM4405456.1 adenosine deaminase [Salmonella enterica subsp. enterica serovar Give]ECT8080644.1 adenosine deaminase [Salmonella enterica subsp. enterica serovar Carrau]EAA2616299.1 adenosine deaminase [Salmonella enterica]EAM2930518.1 adenosine deaminase [Salmonella enterica]
MNFDARNIPKIELHVHLDTCISYHCARMLMPSLNLRMFRMHFIAPNKCNDLSDFLSRITPQLDLLQTTCALRQAVDDIFDQLHADGVIYAELRFAPLLHLNQSLTAEEVVETVLGAMHARSQTYGIEANLILCTLRHFSEQQSMETARLVARYLGKGVVALDLAADEARFPLDNHIKAFDFVRSHGGNCIAHAGEARGFTSVNETLDNLNVSRIGHGVRSVEDRATLDRLLQENIHLEVCPGCNIVCNVYPSIGEHPVNALFHEGISLSINTDARTVANTTLNQEYQRLHHIFGWKDEEFLTCNLNAALASFALPHVKQGLQEILRSQVRPDQRDTV